VPVFVPAEMAADVMRRVADHLQSGAATTGVSDWADATAQDKEVFFRDLPDIEWQLVQELARYDRPVPVAEVAEALGVEVGDVAGAMGPINKRAKREGWVAPIRPGRFTPEGTRSSKRGLLLHEGLRAWAVERRRPGRRSDVGQEAGE
jgi:hypothetical protein